MIFYTPSYLLAEIDQLDSARFLSQSTLGYTEANVTELQALGYQKWIRQQVSIPPTLLEPYIETIASRRKYDANIPPENLPYQKVNSKQNNVGYRNISTAWMRAVLSGNDRLRQRVAWALSQIVVTSIANNRLTEGSSNYYDLLLKHAFSNYDELLIDVTFHPVMGRYLSYMGNRKASTNNKRQPDENYAREIMQLFTIGLWQLNPDGSKKLNSNNEPIPTYTNDDITELSRVFTGFWLNDTVFGRNDWEQYDSPMTIVDRHHDKKAKSLLKGHIKIEPNTSPKQEILYAIKRLTKHENVAPFLSKKLINHLVTSNPSKQYVERVSTVWANTNGNLGKVVESILLDPEARDNAYKLLPEFGRLKDPIQRITNILIGFECGADIGHNPKDYPGLQWWRPEPLKHLSQAPMQAPSVFNFFEPEYSKPGTIADSELYSPEFQILNDATASSVPNYIWSGLLNGFHRPMPFDKASPLTCTFPDESKQSIIELLNKANLLLSAGSIDAATLSEIRKLVTTQSEQKHQAAVFAVAISPNATIQR